MDLIFDGYCDFCIRALRVVKRFDPEDRLTLIDGNDSEYVRSHYPELDAGDLAMAMYGVANGRYYRGYDAFARAFSELPSLSALAAFMRIPLVRWVGLPIYDAIARNRRSFGCSSGVCQRP